MIRLLRALIVEDSEDDTALLVRELRKGGYEVTVERVETAESLEKALKDQTWDMVIADYNLPRFSALAAFSPKTVETYRSRLMQKLDVHDVLGLVKFAIQYGPTPLK